MGEDFHHIGKSHTRLDAPSKVIGETRFLSDIYVDRMVFAAPVYSSLPFARIKRVDLSAAREVPGFIHAVFAEHIPGKNQVGVIVEDQPLLADDVARFVGDTIGVVIGETEEVAHRISKMVRVEYEVFEPYLSIDDSKSAKANFIHNNNIACTHNVIKGDVEKGFEGSDIIIKESFRTPSQEHYYLEPQGCIAVPEDNGGMTLHGSLQCPFYVQKAVAKVLELPLSKVRVIPAPIGGAFGGKEDIPSEICARAALAALIVKRPVKMVYPRADDVQLTSKRHPFQMQYKVGVSKEGKLLVADIILEENAGAYATLSSVVSYRAAMHAMGPYVIPNIRVNSTSYYTNLPPNGAFRGFGAPQATFGHERIMDVIAEKLGMDPVVFRLKNILKVGDSTLTSHKLTVSVGAEETILKACVAANWEQSRQERIEADHFLEGIGIATSHYGNCLGAAGWFMDGVGVRIQIRRDGSVGVSFGLVEMGQGALTVVAQMTAEALGVSMDRITVLPTDTFSVPDSGPSVASRNVVMTGNAIRDAADKLLIKLRAAAVELLECEVDQIEIKDGTVLDALTGNTLDFSELTDYLFTTNRQMDMVGWWHVPALKYDPEIGQGEAYFTYSYATHIARVLVDTLTGQVQVKNIWAAHDIGKAINPAGLEGQVEGGTAQGIGWAVTENFQIQDGKVITTNLSTYLLPTSADVADVKTIIVEDAEPLGPWGAKGIGEPSIIPTGAAIANAVSHALGVQMNEIPITPENVLNVLQSKSKDT